jgi:hemolysin activation/secretion protein
MRLEGAYLVDADALPDDFYGRGVLDATLTRPLGGFSVSLTGAAGSSVGSLPLQRAFYVGGLHTVRGQFARLGEGRVGDAFWLGRAELGQGSLAFRPTVFYDVGWAGPRQGIGGDYRPMSGAGFGLSFLDGFVRMDVSRGIWPEKKWRFDAYLGARF